MDPKHYDPRSPLGPEARDLLPEQLEALYEARGLRPGYYVTVRWIPNSKLNQGTAAHSTPWRGVVLEAVDQKGEVWLIARKHILGKGFAGTEHVIFPMIEAPSLLERLAFEVNNAELVEEARRRP